MCLLPVGACGPAFPRASTRQRQNGAWMPTSLLSPKQAGQKEPAPFQGTRSGISACRRTTIRDATSRAATRSSSSQTGAVPAARAPRARSISAPPKSRRDLSRSRPRRGAFHASRAPPAPRPWRARRRDHPRPSPPSVGTRPDHPPSDQRRVARRRVRRRRSPHPHRQPASQIEDHVEAVNTASSEVSHMTEAELAVEMLSPRVVATYAAPQQEASPSQPMQTRSHVRE